MSGRRLEGDGYLDKVRGGWVGKSLGGSVGHFEGTKRITRFRMTDLLTEGVVANDDLDIQLVWLDLLLEVGVEPTAAELMACWVERYDYNFGEYGFARRNHLRGIEPPVSGAYANRYYGTGMGCAIRAEIWAMIAPGAPDLAARFAEVDGSLDHVGDAIHAERMLAALESEAFFRDDLGELLEVGLEVVPRGCELDRAVRQVREDFAAGLSWESAWTRLRDEFGHPDCTYVPMNLGIIAGALLWGLGDMERTQTLAVNAGWDVDCTCATTGALLGIRSGWSGMDSRWRDYVGDTVVTLARPRRSWTSLLALSEDTCAVGREVSRAVAAAARIEAAAPSTPTATVPRRAPPPPLQLSVRYHGLPEISPGRPAIVTIHVENRGRVDTGGTLAVRAPAGLTAHPAAAPVRCPAGSAVEVTVRVGVAPGATGLADTNQVTVGLAGAQRTFGLAGAATGLGIGPFFDSCDDWLDRRTLRPGRVLRTPTDEVSLPEMGEEWGNHRVDIDKPYTDEGFEDALSTSSRFSRGRIVRVTEDCLRVADQLGFQGPCVLYSLFEIHSPSERRAHLFLGSTDPFKVWWNGVEVFRQARNTFWFPNNDVVEIPMREGANHLVLKIARTGEDNRTSFLFRHRPVLAGYDSSAFITDLSWGLDAPARQNT